MTEEVSEGNIQVTDTKNGCFSSQFPLWKYTIHPCSTALLPHLQIEKHQKIPERLQAPDKLLWCGMAICSTVLKSMRSPIKTRHYTKLLVAEGRQ